MTQSALVLTFSRCGGGFLIHSLASHPEMIFDDSLFWLRGLYDEKPTQEQRERLFDCLLNRAFRTFAVSGAKAFPHQIAPLADSFWLDRDVKFILLRRRNVLRVIFASEAKRAAKKGRDLPIKIDVRLFIKRAQRRLGQYRDAQEFADQIRSKGVRVLELDYADIVGGEGKTARYIDPVVGRRLCDFLGVRYRKLSPTSPYFDTRQHPVALRAGVSNWTELKRAIERQGWGRWLEQERVYS